jgi:3-phenylpropionate/trans-cinnamate dioxygenase ferredoxin subunit
MTQATWHPICTPHEVTNGMQVVEINRRKIVVTRVKDQLYAFDNFCSHVGGPMHRGEIDSTIVTCPLHGWRFDLTKNGEETHGYKPIKMFPVREEAGTVEILL